MVSTISSYFNKLKSYFHTFLVKTTLVQNDSLKHHPLNKNKKEKKKKGEGIGKCGKPKIHP